MRVRKHQILLVLRCTIRREDTLPAYSQLANRGCMVLKALLLWTVVNLMGVAYTLHAAEPVRYPANPANGFSYPYYLFVPPGVDTNPVLVVESNNTGTWNDDFAVHDAAANDRIAERMSFASDLRSPFLVPVFPEPASNSWLMPDPPEPATNAFVYTQSLARDCFFITNSSLQRLDLQLMAMIADARARLTTQGISTDPKVFIMGFSAAGMFANRFTALHPGLIKALAVGAPGGWPLVPVSTWRGESLRFPVGICDVGALTGTNFDLTTYTAVPHYFFMGDQDTNAAQDAVWMRSDYNAYARVDSEQIIRLFGTNTQQRWPVAQSVYVAAGCTNAQFVTYAGVGHTLTDQMQDDIKRFFYPTRHFLKRGVHAELGLCLDTDAVRLEWASLPGLTYHLESSTNLAGWLSDGTAHYLGDGLLQTYQVPLSNQPARFFRMRSEYVVPGGGQGRFFFLKPTSWSTPFTVSCGGLTSGSCQVSAAGPGNFTYSEQNSDQATLVIDLPTGEHASFSLAISNTTSGTFQGAYVNASVTNFFGGAYETLRTP